MTNIRKLCTNVTRWLTKPLLTFFIVFTLIGTTLFAADDSTPLVTIDNDTISVGDLKNEIVSQHQMMTNPEKSSFDYHKLLDKLINDRLIIHEAYNMGIDEEPWLIDKLDKMTRTQARNAYLRANFKPDTELTQEEMRKFFDEYYFRMKLRTVTVATYEEALDVKKKLESGAAMDSLARAISIDTKKAMGGAHNFSHYADIENVLRIPAKELKVGEFSDPVPFSSAFVIIHLEDYRDPDTLEFPILTSRIKTILGAEKQEAAWAKFVDSIKNLHPYTTNEEIFGKIKADANDDIFTKEFRLGSLKPVFSIDENCFINESEVRNGISYLAMTKGDLSTDSLLTLSIANLTTEMYLDYEAAKHGFLENDAMTKFNQHNLDSALIDLYLQEVIAKQIKFNHQEFEEYYNEHLDEFREPADLQLANLNVSTADSANMIYQRLKEGANFDFVFNQVDPNNTSQSNPIGWESMKAFPENIQEVFNNLPIGSYTEPFEVTRGWVIFYLKNKKLGRQLSMEEVDSKIRTAMFRIKFDSLLTENLDLLKANSEIKKFNKNIDSFFN